MKKNKMMRLASAMMVLTLISTSVISGTFAKYTTQDSGSDVARVAKWGVELQVVGSLYGKNYLNVGNGNTATATETGLTVKSKDASNVVAPGTKNAGNGFSFFLKGQPEVESNVEVDIFAQNIYLAEGTYGTLVVVPATTITEANYATLQPTLYVEDSSGVYKLADAGTFDSGKTYYTLEDKVTTSNYYPVVYTLNGATSTVGSVNAASDSLKTAAEKILSAASGASATLTPSTDGTLYSGTITKTYAVNTDLSGLKLNNTNLTWEWAFGATDKIGDNADVTDMADTILGNLIADTASDTYKIVKKTNSDEYTTVNVKEVSAPVGASYSNYKVATVGDATVACLTTQFAIDITVTQVD